MRDNKNKALFVLLIVTFIFSLFTVYVYSQGSSKPSISARAAVLYDCDSGNFLYEKNPRTRLGMASTTKIMTAIIAIENLNVDDKVTVDDRCVGVEGSSIYLKQGETLTVKDLLYSLMLRSANDAADALAYALCYSTEDFCFLMNEKAKELGLSDTRFENAHGLDDKNHYTTAHDLAIITAYALSNPIFREIVSSGKYTFTSSCETRLLINHNKLLSSYNGCIGVKTGYTKKSGRSLVSAAKRNEKTLICVTINAPDDWNDHRKMLNYGFSVHETNTFVRHND